MDRRVKTVRARLASPCTCDAQPIVRVRQIAPARPRFVLSPAFRAVAHVAYGAPRLARRRDRRAVDGVLAWVDDRPRVSRTCGVADTPLQCHDALRQRGRSELSFVDDCISQPCGKLARVRQARAHHTCKQAAPGRVPGWHCSLHVAPHSRSRRRVVCQSVLGRLMLCIVRNRKKNVLVRYLVMSARDIPCVGCHVIGRISHPVGCRTRERGISRQQDILIAARISRNRDIQLQVRYPT